MRRWMMGIMLFAVLWVGAARAIPARAQAPDAQAIIDAVNALRASRGLAPYSVDAEIMAYAQQHSDYQASTGNMTHTHSDGTTPWAYGLDENVAVGSEGFITVDFIMNQVWSDPVHMKTMVGYATGGIGVGVASNGDTVYYTLDVRPTGGTLPQAAPTQAAAQSSQSGSAQATAANPIPVESLITSTPLGDGSVYHVIEFGQTLWSIALAYGVTVQQIRDFNSIPENSTDIYAGQRLLIKLPGTPYSTPTSTATETPLVSETPSPTNTYTPAPSRTPTHTPEPVLATATTQPTRTELAASSEATPAVSIASAVGTNNWRTPLGMALLVLAAFGIGVWVGQFWAERKARAG